MAADVLVFEEFAGSGRGLLARPILMNNANASPANISLIEYLVYLLGNPVPVFSGELVIADVLSATMTPWPNKKDSIGFSFLWPADGDLWPDPGQQYRIIVRFTTTPVLGSKKFILAWQANTFAPSG